MFALSLLITPPAQQKGPLNSCCAHDISIVLGASLAARPGAEKLRLDKNQEETPVGTGEKEEALAFLPQVLSGNRFYSLLLLTCFVWVLLLLLLFLKPPNSLLPSFISTHEKFIPLQPSWGSIAQGCAFVHLPLQKTDISHNRIFKIIHLCCFPPEETVGLYLSCFNREQ